MNGKLVGITLIAVTAVAGIGMWYMQEYYYYARIPGDSATLTVQTTEGAQALAVAQFQGIDADSSPLRWRACGVADMPADPLPYTDATPLVGPRWFDCFDAAAIGADLESGAAQPVLAQADIHPDVDRVLAVYPDGRVYGWHQYNEKNPERGVMD